MEDKNNDRPENDNAGEITPEMISAGVDELCGHYLSLTAPDSGEYAEIVRTVFERMDALRPSRGCAVPETLHSPQQFHHKD